MGRGRVVIVDDDLELCTLLSESFKESGFDVQTFYNGKDALQYLVVQKQFPKVSLLVLDRLLPDMDGLELLRAARSHFQQSIPVLILSVLAPGKALETDMESGSFEYFEKPFQKELFMQKATGMIHE